MDWYYFWRALYESWYHCVAGTLAEVLAILYLFQDPQHPELHDTKTYYFVKNSLTARNKEEQSSDPLSRITLTTTSERIFKELKEKGV